MVFRFRDGAPEGALAAAVAPIGVVEFTPLSAITVAEAEAERESRACMLELFNALADHALQISAVPACRLDLAISLQVSPAVETDETSCAEPLAPSVEKNAKSNFPDPWVVSPETVIDELALP
jgi:hypothetical protein